MVSGGQSKDPLIGAVLGKCKILSKLGQGGMGDVYLAQHQFLRKNVALKILPVDFSREKEAVVRFQREAVSAAKLEHPNTVQIHDIGIERGRYYIVMQFVDGQTLQGLIDQKDGPMELKEAGHIIRECAKGLKAAHDHGIVHRDIKPANILISKQGEVKITDFGLAFDQGGGSQMTQTGMILGTPHFISPEQADGKRANEQSDIYALGVIFYYLVTGVKPFDARSQMGILYKHIHEKPKPVREINPNVPPGVTSIIQKMMAKKASGRHQIVEELIQELDRVIARSSGQKVSVPARRRHSQPPASSAPRNLRSRADSRHSASSSRLVVRQRSPMIALIWLGSLVAVLATVIMVIILTSKSDTPVPSEQGKERERTESPPKSNKQYTLLVRQGDRLIGEKDYPKAIETYRKAQKERDTPEIRRKIRQAGERIFTLKDRALWLEVERENTIEAYNRYLATHPDGKHAGQARTNRSRLKERISAAEDQALWMETEQENTIEAYDRYLATYPDGKYAGQARKKRTELEVKRTPAPEDFGFTLLKHDAKDPNLTIDFCNCLKGSSFQWRQNSVKIVNEPTTDKDKIIYHYLWTKRNDIADGIFKGDIYLEKGSLNLFCRYISAKKAEAGRNKYVRWPPSNTLIPKERWVSFTFKAQGDIMELWLDGKYIGKKFIPSDVSRFGRLGFLFHGSCSFQVRGMKLKVLRTTEPEHSEETSSHLQKKRAEALELIEGGNWEKGRDQLLSVLGNKDSDSTLVNQVCQDLFRIAQREEWESLRPSFEEWIRQEDNMEGDTDKISTTRSARFSPTGAARTNGLSMKFRIGRLGAEGGIGFEIWNTANKKPVRYTITREQIQLKVVGSDRKSQSPLAQKSPGKWISLSVIQFRDVFIFYMDGKSIWKTTPGAYQFRGDSGLYFQDVDAEIDRIRILP